MSSVSQSGPKWSERYGPWALITGASDGIGHAMASELAARGLNVILVARRGNLLDILAADLAKNFGVNTRVLIADLTDSADVSRVAEQTDGTDIGLLVASAGFGTSGRIQDTNLSDELSMIDLNCKAVFALTKNFADRFARRGRGGIVLFSSIVAFQGVPNASNYAATKAYIQTLTEGLRTELSARNVDILSCAPGPVRSGFAARSDLRMGSATSPATVARETLNALGRKTTVWPGFLSKILIGSLALLPRFARTAIMGRIMAGMTKHQYEGKT
jgi:short-subunit dehydrogenase